MKRMIQMLVCCVLATVLVMGSMANAMAQSMVGEPFILEPGQSQNVQINPPDRPILVRYLSPIPTTVAVQGGSCNQQTSVPPPGITQNYNCGSTSAVMFRNEGNGSVLVYPN